MRLGVLAVAVTGVVFAVAGCGETTIDAGAAEDSIVDFVVSETGVTPEDMSCPSDVPAEVDETFECTFTAPDGDYVAEVTVTSVNDDTAEFEINAHPAE